MGKPTTLVSWDTTASIVVSRISTSWLGQSAGQAPPLSSFSVQPPATTAAAASSVTTHHDLRLFETSTTTIRKLKERAEPLSGLAANRLTCRQRRRGERVREQLGQGEAPHRAVPTDADHGECRGELDQHLAAEAARRRRLCGVGRNRQHPELPRALS